MAVVAGHLALELAGDERDGGERRAEFVGGGGGEPVEGREMLLAGEHHFGRVERAGELPRLLGDAEGVDAGEGAGRDQRHPDADRVDPGKRQRLAGMPGEGQVAEGEHGGHHDDDRAEEDRRERRRASSPRRSPARGAGSRTDSRGRR